MSLTPLPTTARPSATRRPTALCPTMMHRPMDLLPTSPSTRPLLSKCFRENILDIRNPETCHLFSSKPASRELHNRTTNQVVHASYHDHISRTVLIFCSLYQS